MSINATVVNFFTETQSKSFKAIQKLRNLTPFIANILLHGQMFILQRHKYGMYQSGTLGHVHRGPNWMVIFG